MSHQCSRIPPFAVWRAPASLKLSMQCALPPAFRRLQPFRRAAPGARAPHFSPKRASRERKHRGGAVQRLPCESELVPSAPLRWCSALGHGTLSPRPSQQLQPDRAGVSSVTLSLPSSATAVPASQAASSTQVTLWFIQPTASSRSAATNSSQSATDSPDTRNVKPLLDLTYSGVLLPAVSGSDASAGSTGKAVADLLAAYGNVDTAQGSSSVTVSSARLPRRGVYQGAYNVYTMQVSLSVLASGLGGGATSGVAAAGNPSPTSSPEMVLGWQALVTSAAVCPTSVQYAMLPNQQDSSVTVEITNLDVQGVVVVVTPSLEMSGPTSIVPSDGILRLAEFVTPPGEWRNATVNTNPGQQYADTACEDWACAFSASAVSPIDGFPYAFNLTAHAQGAGAHPTIIPKGLTAAAVPAGSTLGVYLSVFYAYPGSIPRLDQDQTEHFTLHFFEEVSNGDPDYFSGQAGVPQYRLLEQRVVEVGMQRLLGQASRARSQLIPLRRQSSAFVNIMAQGQGLRPVALLALRDAFGHPRPCAGDVPAIDAEQILVDLPGGGSAGGAQTGNGSTVVTSYTAVGPGLYLVSMRAALPGLVQLSARLSSASTAPLQPLQVKVLPANCTAGSLLPDTAQNNMTCLCSPGHGGAISDGISAAVAQNALRDQGANSAQLAALWSPQVQAAMDELVLEGMPQSIAQISLATGGFADTGGIDVCNIYTQATGEVSGGLNIPAYVPEADAFRFSALEAMSSLAASKESSGRVECSPCEPGERSSGYSVEQCLSCSAGQFSAPGSETCKACPDSGATCVNGVLRVDDDHWWERGETLSAADAATSGLRFHSCPLIGLCNVEDVRSSDAAAADSSAAPSGGARRLAAFATNLDFETGKFLETGRSSFNTWWAEARGAAAPEEEAARHLQSLGNFSLVNDSSLSLSLAALSEQRVYCFDGHTGPLCQSCVPGYVNAGTGACSKCTGVVVSWILMVLAVIFIAAFAVFWIRRRVRRSRFRTTQSGSQRIGLSFIQMCTVLTALRLRVPELFGVIEQGGSVGDGVSMDLYPVQCTFHPTYHNRLLGYMLMPVIAMILPAIVLFATLPCRRAQWEKREAKRQELIKKLGAEGATGDDAAAASGKDDAMVSNPLRVAGSKATPGGDESSSSPAESAKDGSKAGEGAKAKADGKGKKKPRIPRPELPPTVEGSKNLAYASAVVLVFLVYNRVFRELVSAFHEYQYPVEGHPRLAADLTVLADSPEHLFWRVIAGILLAVYAVGLPIGTLILLYRNREHLWPTAEGLALEDRLKRGVLDGKASSAKKPRRQSQAFREAVKIQGKMERSDQAKLSALLAQHQVFHRFSFLYDGYRHDLYWWETLVVVRKILVVLVSATITDGHTQMFAAAGIITVALALQLSVQPYLIPALNALETLSLVSTLILMLGSLLFWQVGSEPGPATALTAVLFVVLIVTLIIFLYGMGGNASKSRLRKAIGEKHFKTCTRCIKRSCKNKRSPAEIRAEMLADEAQYDAALQGSSNPMAKKAAAAESKQAFASSGIGTDGGGMMTSPLAGRPLAGLGRQRDEVKTRTTFEPKETT